MNKVLQLPSVKRKEKRTEHRSLRNATKKGSFRWKSMSYNDIHLDTVWICRNLQGTQFFALGQRLGGIFEGWEDGSFFLIRPLASPGRAVSIQSNVMWELHAHKPGQAWRNTAHGVHREQKRDHWVSNTRPCYGVLSTTVCVDVHGTYCRRHILSPANIIAEDDICPLSRHKCRHLSEQKNKKIKNKKINTDTTKTMMIIISWWLLYLF